jgi:hypothetical protein
MKKTFPLHIEGQDDQRVLSAIKVDLVRYVKRERRKALPEGSNYWDFRCQVGPDRETPAATPLAAIPAAVDAIARAGGAQVYVEILAQPAHRELKSATTPAQREDS